MSRLPLAQVARRLKRMKEAPLRGAFRRLLQLIALYAPGSKTLRPRLHRLRGVDVGEGVFIGTAAIIETSQPELVSIGDNVVIGLRSTIIAHFRGSEPDHGYSVRIEAEASIGPGAIVLPNVTIGRGAVVTAGSVVTKSVPELIMVQGNPAQPIARCGLPLGRNTPLKEFYSALRPLRAADAGDKQPRPGEHGPVAK